MGMINTAKEKEGGGEGFTPSIITEWEICTLYTWKYQLQTFVSKATGTKKTTKNSCFINHWYKLPVVNNNRYPIKK